MIYLLLGIVCSSSLALLFKYTESKEMNRYFITTINYITASGVSGFLFFQAKPNMAGVNLGQFFLDVQGIMTNKAIELGPSSSIMWALILGAITGLLYYISFILYQKSVRESGASLSGMFGKLGILIPMIISIIVWREFPTALQSLGILLALASIIIVNIDGKNGSFQWKITLIFLFIMNGFAEFANKLFQKYALVDYKSLFLFTVFFVALIISLSATIKFKKKPTGKDLLLGIMVGIPNLFSSFFLIEALRHLPASVAFPIYSAGSIVIIILGSSIIYKEKIRSLDWIAISITLISMVFINI